MSFENRADETPNDGKGGSMKIVILGGAAFEAATLAQRLRAEGDARVVYIASSDVDERSDAFTSLAANARFASFVVPPDDTDALADILNFERPDAVIELARAGDAADATSARLSAVGKYWGELAKGLKGAFRYIHVWPNADANGGGYGVGEANVAVAAEKSGLPALTVRCAPYFGAYQDPTAKLPLWITNAILGRDLPLGDMGLQRSAWMTAEDWGNGVFAALASGSPGSRYALEPKAQISDLQLLHGLCEVFDDAAPRADGRPHVSALVFDGPLKTLTAPGKTADAKELPAPGDWAPAQALGPSLAAIVDWYVQHASWWIPLRLSDMANAASAPKLPAAAKAKTAA